jgi:hypothetical protein
MGTVALCAAYNLAAWVVRGRPHSAINAGIYTAFVIWECVHVKHHIDSRSLTPRHSQPDRAAA